MTEGDQDFTDVTSSNVEGQCISVEYLRITAFDDSINKILNCIQKDHLIEIDITFDKNAFEPLKESIELFGFENLVESTLDGGNGESNLVSFDFIPKTCTPENLPKLGLLSLYYCLIDPGELRYLLHMHSLSQVSVMLFLDQHTEENQRITNEVIKSRNKFWIIQ